MAPAAGQLWRSILRLSKGIPEQLQSESRNGAPSQLPGCQGMLLTALAEGLEARSPLPMPTSLTSVDAWPARQALLQLKSLTLIAGPTHTSQHRRFTAKISNHIAKRAS